MCTCCVCKENACLLRSLFAWNNLSLYKKFNPTLIFRLFVWQYGRILMCYLIGTDRSIACSLLSIIVIMHQIRYQTNEILDFFAMVTFLVYYGWIIRLISLQLRWHFNNKKKSIMWYGLLLNWYPERVPI